MGTRKSLEPFQVSAVQGECVLDLVLASSAELSCRSGTESLDLVGGTAATPEPTSGSIYILSAVRTWSVPAKPGRQDRTPSPWGSSLCSPQAVQEPTCVESAMILSL